MEFNFIDADYGIPNANNGDLFIMLVDPVNGSTIGLDIISSSDIDNFLALGVNNCNEAYLMANFSGTTTSFRNKTYNIPKYSQMFVKFPIFGTCNNPCVVTVPLSVEEKVNQMNFEYKFSPNPTSGFIFYNGSIDHKGLMEIYNIDGERVFSGELKEKTDIKGLTNGVYIIKYINDKNLTKTEKIIVIN